MIEQSNNTYFEFSFQKSLRKYEKPPHKKIKTNHCLGKFSSSACKHCLEKLHKRDSLQSTDRKNSLINCRKNEFIKSRILAREFSQTKRKRENELSAKKQQQSHSAKKQDCDVLSQFNVEEHINRSIHVKSNQKNNRIESELSIQKVLQSDLDCVVKPKCLDFNQRSFEQLEPQKNRKNSCIIQEQDESFSQIQIAQLGQIKTQDNHLSNTQPQQKKLCQTELNANICDYPAISYAYFSSCSSLQSYQSSNRLDHKQNICEEKQMNEQNENIDIRTPQKKNMVEQIESRQVEILKLQSKEQLKKEFRQEFRERTFYKIKKINSIEQACSECESISQQLKRQLSLQDCFKSSPDLCEQQKQKFIESAVQTITDQSEDHPLKDTINKQNLERVLTQHSKIDYSTLSPQSKNQFKRERGSYPGLSFRKKSKRINFEIQQNYQNLGRIKITGLGHENQSICLSIRRFKSIDKTKIIDYLILQRPYLQQNREVLLELLSNITEAKNQQNTLFEQNKSN